MSLTSFLLYIGLFFLTPRKNEFLKVSILTVFIATIYILFLNIQCNLLKATNKKSIQQIEDQMQLNDQYFHTCIKNINNKKELLLLLKNWRNETTMIKNNIQFIRNYIV
ncbi:hypothetical protein MHK_010651, partial [Candidatus Magnetomorum sp. HK-1]